MGVDIVFDGKNGNRDSWFEKNKVVKINQGPNVKKNVGFNYWKMIGHTRNPGLQRHFFVNRQYGGCGADIGMLVVSDTLDACHTGWMKGEGWESIPRFLYASRPDGCNWHDTECAKEADIFTISVQ